jgi:hypothetical protein
MLSDITQIIGIIRDITIICVSVLIVVTIVPLAKRLLEMFTSFDKLIERLNSLSNGTETAYNFGKVVSFITGFFGKKNKD